MGEWIVDVQSMIPVGEIGERMIVAWVDQASNQVKLMQAPTIRTTDQALAGDGDIFMRSHGITSAFRKGEIDQFLQAMMDAGWKRGLRPVGFDPSAGELAAVNRHLEDLRKIAMQRVDLPAAVTQSGEWSVRPSASVIGRDGDPNTIAWQDRARRGED